MLIKMYYILRFIYHYFYRIFLGTVISNEFGLCFRIKTPSDLYVFKEIYGNEDAYRRECVIPLMNRGTVLEIGAHKGFFSLLAARHASRVLAFEPDSENFQYLQTNIKLNSLNNVIPVNSAVSWREGLLEFTVSGLTAARHTLFASSFSGDGVKVQVQSTTLSAIFERYGLERVALLKMDCEGSEYDIIYRTEKSIFDRIDAIVLEIHEIESLQHNKDDLLRYLHEELGYNIEVYDERWLQSLHVWMAIATKSTTSDSNFSNRSL